jgi:ATP diphosphatase
MSPAGREAVRQEFGDLLFAMANIARHLHVDPEAALREANAKFTRRFRKIEGALAREGRKPEDATLEEMDRLWDAAKAEEGK